MKYIKYLRGDVLGRYEAQHSHVTAFMSSFQVLLKLHSLSQMIPGDFQNQKAEDRLEKLLKAKRKENTDIIYGCYSNQMHVHISLPFFPNSHYTPGFKLITSGNPFKLFIKMKENGDSSLVVFFFSNGLKIKRKGNSK